MGFEAGVYTIRESRRRVELPIVITDPPSGGAPWPFTLLLNTYGNSAGIQYIYTFACEITVLCCADSPGDFEAQIDRQITFNTGDTRVVHTINIVNDDICESPQEFFSRISLFTQDRHINIARSQARVVISDSTERECGKITPQISSLSHHFFYFCVHFIPSYRINDRGL